MVPGYPVSFLDMIIITHYKRLQMHFSQQAMGAEMLFADKSPPASRLPEPEKLDRLQNTFAIGCRI
jgi:hypothetical protein